MQLRWFEALARDGLDIGRSHLQKPLLLALAIVCMDLSKTSRSIAGTYFPKAMIIADRMQVVRLALQRHLAGSMSPT